MANFTPRLTDPTATDPLWLHTSKGGKNECIIINKTTGSVLPNCVGYAWGRFYEATGSRPMLSKANAENWYGNTSDGYRRGQTPKLGAVICWRKGQAGNGADGAGHVANVEVIYDNGDLLLSESNYSGARWKTRKVTKASGYYLGSAYTFQGFIYPPQEFNVEPIGTPVARNTSMTQIEVLIDVLRGRKRPELNDATILGYVKPGIYNVMEVRDMTAEASNGYLWYKIEPDLWIASKEGEWTKLYPATQPDTNKDKWIAELTAENANLRAQVDSLNASVNTLQKQIDDAIAVLEK